MIPVVYLHPREIRAAHEGGRARMEAGPVTPLEAGVDPLFHEVLGCMGEIGVCRAYRVAPDLEIYATRGEAGADLEVAGKTVNVKSTAPWKSPHLLVLASRKLKHEIYLLAGVKLREGIVTLWGYATREEVAAVEPASFRGSSPTRAIFWGDLHPCHPPNADEYIVPGGVNDA